MHANVSRKLIMFYIISDRKNKSNHRFAEKKAAGQCCMASHVAINQAYCCMSIRIQHYTFDIDSFVYISIKFNNTI